MADLDFSSQATPAPPLDFSAQATPESNSDEAVFGDDLAGRVAAANRRFTLNAQEAFSHTVAGEFLTDLRQNTLTPMVGNPQHTNRAGIPNFHDAYVPNEKETVAGDQARSAEKIGQQEFADLPAAQGVGGKAVALSGQLIGGAATPENLIAPEVAPEISLGKSALARIGGKLIEGAINQAPVAAVGALGSEELRTSRPGEAPASAADLAQQIALGTTIGAVVHAIPEAKRVYTSPVPASPVLSGEMADASVAHSNIGPVLDAFGEGPRTNWGVKDVVAGLDTKALPNDFLKDLAQGQAEATKSFNEAFQRSAASSALVQAGPSIAEQLASARSMAIIGEGEAGWKGTLVPDDAQVAARAEAAKILPTEPEAAAGPDVHDIARQIAPHVFEGPNGYDALLDRQDTFRRWIGELSETRDQQFADKPPLGDEISTVQGKIDGILSKVGGIEEKLTKTKASQLDDLRGQLDDLRDQSKETARQDTPDMQRVRQALIQNDYKMRDMAEQVSAAYREARGHLPEEPTAEPLPVAQETPEPIPAVAEQPSPEPEPVAQEIVGKTIAEESAPKPVAEPLGRAVPPNVASDVSAKLIAAGRPAEEANAAGALIQSHYEARAARFRGALGTGPELYAREAPEVRAGRGAPAQVREREYAQGGGKSFKAILADAESKGVSIHASEGQNRIALSKIVVPKEGRGAGVGSAVMQDIADYADATGKDIVLTPSADFGGNVSRLKQFYKRFDFVENKGRNRDFSTQESMIRSPQKGYDQSARGKIAFKNGQSLITLMEDANASTFLHETGHQWLEEMMKDAEHPQAPGDLLTDAKSVRDYLGIKDGEAISTKQHEKFARSFERYMMEGTAPTKGLADVFAKFKQWLTSIYETVAKLRAPINDDIRAVFDRLVATPDEAVVAREREPSATFADMHEAEAANTLPEHADPVRDTVEKEIVQVAEQRTPDIAPSLANDGEAGGIATEAGGDTAGPGAAGSGPGAAGGPEEPGAVSGGGSEPGSEGAGTRDTASPTPGKGAGNSEPIGPTGQFPDTESELVDKAGNIRLDNIETPEQFKQAIREAAERNDDFLEKRRGVVSDAQRDALANVMGVTPDKIFSRKIGEAFSDSEIKMLEKTLADSAMNVHALAVKAADGTEADLAALTQAYIKHDMIQGAYSQATAEAGRALRALRKSQEFWTQQSAATNELLKQNITDATGRTLFQMRNIAKKIANLETPGQVSKFVRDSQRTGVFDWMQATFINALISGPLTHMGYTAAGEMFALFRATAETSAAAAVGGMRRATGYGEAEYAHIGEMNHQLYGMYRGGRNGVKAAWQAWKSNNVVLPEEVVRQQDLPGTTGQPINSTKVIPNPEIMGRSIPIGTVIESPGRLVAALHSFNWTTFYSQSISGQAFRQAIHEGMAPGSSRFINRVAELTSSPTDPMIQTAMSDASSGALMERPAYDSFMGNVSRLTNFGIKVPDLPLPGGKEIPMGTLRPLKYIDPFVQIQANIQKTAFGRGTPLALFSKSVRDDLSMKNGGVAFDRTAGRIIAGTGFMIAAGGLAAEGLLNGSAPSDPRQAREWQRIHGLPHGLTVGNLSFDMLRLGNLGLQMSVAADLYQFGHHISDGDASQAAAQLVTAFSQNILDESSMRGPAQLMRAVDEHDRYGDAWIRNFVSSSVPFSVGLSQVSRQIDPYSREARTTMDAIKAKIPFLSETLLPRYDVWGQPVANRGWALAPNVTLAHDPVDEKLYALGVYPSLPERRIRNVPLTDQQYADYSRIGGRLAHIRVSQIMQSPGFDNLPAETRIKIVDSAISSSREQARNQIMMQSVGTQDDIVAKAVAAKRQGMH